MPLQVGQIYERLYCKVFETYKSPNYSHQQKLFFMKEIIDLSKQAYLSEISQKISL